LCNTAPYFLFVRFTLKEFKSTYRQWKFTQLVADRSLATTVLAAGIRGPDFEVGRGRARLGMSMKARIWLGVMIGSTIGGFVPELWGADLISYSGVLLSGVGGFVGLWIGYKLS
jgi:predicted MFS family arabinose efflux permease